jgi:hypothetical protein
LVRGEVDLNGVYVFVIQRRLWYHRRETASAAEMHVVGDESLTGMLLLVDVRGQMVLLQSDSERY